MFGVHEVLALLRRAVRSSSTMNAGITRNEGLERSRRLDRLCDPGREHIRG